MYKENSEVVTERNENCLAVCHRSDVIDAFRSSCDERESETFIKFESIQDLNNRRQIIFQKRYEGNF